MAIDPPRRGEVWWVDLGEPRGSAPALYRPGLVVSADSFNKSKLRTVTLVAITRNLRLAALPGNAIIPASDSSLEFDSVANVTQVATVDRGALDRKVCALPDWLMSKVDEGLRLALTLP